ncbi:hypothetical protein [Jiangella alkaliphila]|uniref:Uncharacterized protein n=1 Tax=Jiangella alkaliphila TaxID=419479 RepID=A0A1H2LD39_9ACTN|nr:hypothetical protein [Jiangella alkaliphila]SDU78950.1 hypothetical protein SAMN04488563_5898 [Jiangella alkaliphila]
MNIETARRTASSPDAYRRFAGQAGLSFAEFTGDVEQGGLNAAVRRRACRAAQPLPSCSSAAILARRLPAA